MSTFTPRAAAPVSRQKGPNNRKEHLQQIEYFIECCFGNDKQKP